MRALTDAASIRPATHGVAFSKASETAGPFSTIEPDLYRYPALDPPSFRAAVEEFAASA